MRSPRNLFIDRLFRNAWLCAGFVFAFMALSAHAQERMDEEILNRYRLDYDGALSLEKKAEWSLHVGGAAVHAPGLVDDRANNVMPRKIDSRGIGVIAPGMGLSYSKNKFGLGFIYLRGDSFGNKAIILTTHYNFAIEKNYHLKLHLAVYGRTIPIFYTEDRKIDYTMKWSHKTAKYEIFPIVFFNPAIRVTGPVWVELATSYILSYFYVSVKF